jgi:hypothetical protein
MCRPVIGHRVTNPARAVSAQEYVLRRPSHPSGTYRISEAGLDVTAEVVCLDVDGGDAVVGLTVTASNDEALIPVGSGMLHYVSDAGGPGSGDASVTIPGLPGALCDLDAPPVQPPIFPLQPVQSGNWIVRDR